MNDIKQGISYKLSTDLLIYGAGNLGNRVYYFLKENGNCRVKAFLVQNELENLDEIDQVPVCDYRNFLETKESIVIALKDEEIEGQVRDRLVQEGVKADRIVYLSEQEKQWLMNEQEIPFDSGRYWEQRYLSGGNSGAGSYNRLARFKAGVLNDFVEKNDVLEVVEWGCGDGNQLALAKYPRYTGFDVSQKAVDICRQLYKDDSSKEFEWCGADDFENTKVCDLALSLDVVYHLVEDKVFENYMHRLFKSSNRYSSDYNSESMGHVKHRCFTKWIDENLCGKWKLEKMIKNPYTYSPEDEDNTSKADFYFYRCID